jgi:hypothetical protein
VKRAQGLAIVAGALALLGGCRAPVESVGAWRPDGATSEGTRDAAPDAPPKTGFYLEAEDGTLTDGFTVGSSPAASNDGYIEAPAGIDSETAPGTARATYSFSIEAPATYLMWGRIHSPDVPHNTLWFHVDDGTWYQWRISTGDVFYWDDIHDGTHYAEPLRFDLAAGSHTLEFANSIEQVQLDRIYVTADGDLPPGNDETTPCHPPNSIQLAGACVVSCGSQGGNTCGEAACMGLPTFPVYDCAVCCIVPP